MKSTSEKWTINGVDIAKSLRTGGMVALSAFVLFLVNTLAPQLTGAIPMKYAILTPVLTIIVEMLRRWATNHQA